MSCRVLVLLCERGLSATHLPIETIVAPVGKSDPALDLQTDIIVGDNVGAKINKFLDQIESTVIGRKLGFRAPHVSMCQQHRLRFVSFTALPILID